MIDDELVRAHRARALSPDHPVLRGTAQNPDVYFQARESGQSVLPGRARPSCRTRWTSSPRSTGRQYHLFDYVGAPDAERVIVMMGSGAESGAGDGRAPERARREGRRAQGAPVPAVRRRALRRGAARRRSKPSPCSTAPRSRAASASRSTWTWSPRSTEARRRRAPVRRCRASSAAATALSSKEFTPAMVEGVFDELRKADARRTTSPSASTTTSPTPAWTTIPTSPPRPPSTVRAVFYGLGADGTVGANKNSIKIIGEETDNYAQGYFVYDSKKSGSITISHLRFGPQPIRSSYLISKANFVACHQFVVPGAHRHARSAPSPARVFLLNSPYGPDEVWDHLPRAVQEQIIDKKLQFYVIDALRGRARDRHGRAHQHHHADLLLRHQRRAAARRGHRRHQARHREDLRQARRGGGAEELRRRRRSARPPARSRGARRRSPARFDLRPPVPAERAGVRAAT